MLKNTVIAMATAAVILPSVAFAGDHAQQESTINYTGPIETVTVTDLLSDTGMFTEKKAIVDGVLIKQIDADTFMFSDGVKEIQVDIDDDIVLPQAINANTKVRLFGEYEGGNTPEIEVERIQVL
ncbi:YgiW/YdeI family stress tolerance OB fold protein [Photobacterium nomapromontoriensis]|uniref:YgiW/YdeI family stress tolerance OB fold protein n=1 Tax=Photobacterium nomapromontoriensis TaxID=2910237 RepID=UPI003D1466A2